ncbi:leucine-rich repeat and immunoglobulin-like domain containing-NOGO receptor-interacting protein 4 [Patiria miniata]|uniref:Ig-like domain-containing protein n=1 Tax=Patiria miniata TaxID=46514 RepID=A0A914B1G6_PATMI|nr:leucine-rich repeat and immunoglobulin-like domain containing-NOGO receptor-interacting protein 4 [Patiria miniata]
MDSFAMALILFLIGVLIGACQSSTCHAQCDYDHVTARADCSSLNLSCIPVNYPDSLIMDLSHNDISMLEPDDFSGTFTRLVELYLDYNDISDVTSLLESTGLGSLQKLSLEHNVISALQTSCSLSSLINISVDYNSLENQIYIPSCGALEYFSANFNSLDGIYIEPNLPPIISLRYNQISSFTLRKPKSFHISNYTLLLDYNNINYFKSEGGRVDVLSLSHNTLNTLSLSVPFELNIASNGLNNFKNSFNLLRSGNTFMKKLYIKNNSFDSLVQPDWAEGLQILYADDNMLANLSPTTLQGFINLTELHLANNRLVFISSTALSQLTMLRSLYLDSNTLTSLLGGTFLHQAELVELSMTNNQLSVLHQDYFLGLGSLERLHLAGNRLVYVHTEMLRQMPGLTNMDFSNNTIDVFDITNCSLLSNLQNILLAHNSIHDISYILGHCDNLVVLDLIFNQIQVVPGDSLTGRNRALSRLELEGNPLQCDCRLTGLRYWLRNNLPSVLPRCQGPPQNYGAVVTDLDIQSCEPPKAVTNMSHRYVIVGQTATLSCTATGIPIPNITWLNPNGTVIPETWQDRFFILRDVSLLIISVELSDRGMYTCLVQNILGEIDKAVVNLTVTEELKATPTVTEELKSTHTGVSLAATVLPTMFITLIATLAVVALVICLRRRYKKKDHATSAAEGVRDGSRLTVGFRKTVSTRSDEGYVNDTVEGEYIQPTCKEDTGEEYEVPSTAAGHPSGRYQRHRMVIPCAEMDDADVYEPVNIGGET